MIISWTAGGTLTVLQVDVTVRESHTAAASISDYHVETGSNNTDNDRPESDVITADVFVTNTPIAMPTSNTDGVTGGFAPLQLAVPTRIQLPITVPGIGAALAGAGLLDQVTIQNANTLQFTGQLNRVKSVYNDLYDLLKSATLFNIDTPLRAYTNLLMQTLVTPRDATTGDACTFTITAKQVTFADSEIVTVVNNPGKAKAKGPKPAQVPDDSATAAEKMGEKWADGDAGSFVADAVNTITGGFFKSVPHVAGP